MKNEKIQATIEKLEAEQKTARSQWLKGVYEYALELVSDYEDQSELEKVLTDGEHSTIKKTLLNGANDWSHYSWGGCSLIYDGDICERLATPSEQKRTDYGRLRPNRNEEWLDTQARALNQAFRKIVAVL